MIRSLPRTFGLTLVASLLTGTLSAQGNIKGNRDLAKMIARGVSAVLEKNFYDSKMKGVDWKKALDDAESKIGTSNSVGEMYAAIDEMVLKLDDSHTSFIPPW